MGQIYLSGPQTLVEKREQILALLVTGTPIIAVVIAVTQIFSGRFGILELSLFLPFYVLGELGAEVGLHRYFSHGAFSAKKGMKIFLTIIASISGKGSIFEFAAVHRRHHRFADVEGDPHSPNLSGTTFKERVTGFIHSYYGWIYRVRMNPAEHARVLDLLQDATLRTWGNRKMYYVWLVAGLIAPTITGYFMTGDAHGALIGLLWGGGVRLFFQQHTAFAINSICHLFGDRPYETKDNSRNNIVLAYLTLGVGWHNNHHAFPFTSSNQFHWWQLDICGWFIRACAKLGWCSDLKFPNSNQIQGAKSLVNFS